MFFICDACNESLKKSAIQKHTLACRSCWVLTCLDCNCRFEGEAYKAHVTCISEAEKYQKTAFRAKPAKRDPQAEWCAVIEKAAAAPGPHRSLLATLTGYPNAPRKLKPFISFAKNSLKVHNEKLLTELFASIMAHMPPRPPAAGGGGGGGGSGGGADEEEGGASAAPPPLPSAGRKRTASDAALDAPPPPPLTLKGFLKAFVKAQLRAAPKGRVKTRKLRAEALIEAAAAGCIPARAEGGEEGEGAEAKVFDKVCAKLVKKGKLHHGDFRGTLCASEGNYLCLVAAAGGAEEEA